MESMRVKVDSAHLNECIQKIAIDEGYKWEDYGKIVRVVKANFLYFNMHNKKGIITYAQRMPTHPDAVPSISFNGVKEFERVVQWLKDNAQPKETLIKVGSYDGKISEDGLELVVDCQRFTYREVQKIYEKMKEIWSKNKETKSC